MAKYCMKCGNCCVDHAEYCPRCGTAFVAKSVSPTPIQSMPHPKNSQSALLENVQRFWNRLQSDRQFLRKIVIATVTVVACLVLALALIQRMNSVDGTWVSDDNGMQLVISGDSMEAYYRDEHGELHKSEIVGREISPDKTIDKKKHCMYFEDDDEKACVWYRKKGKILYLYDSIQKYNKNQPDIIFHRK